MDRTMKRAAKVMTSVVGAFLLMTLWLAPTASAVVTCGFVGSTATVTFGAAGESATILRSGNAIFVNGVACGLATVTTTDDIVVADASAIAGSQSVTIDLSGGRFEPGLTGEGGADPVDEIEIDIVDLGGDPGDTLTVTGSSAATPALAADDSVWIEDDAAPPTGGFADFNVEIDDVDDLIWTGVAILNVNSGTGDDYVDASSYTFGPVSINGGDGDDWLAGASGNDVIAAGNGDDTLDYSGFSAPGVSVNLQGNQTATGSGGTDTISGFENVAGTTSNDVLTGDQNDNWIYPGDGNDVASGGSSGNDTVDYSYASGGVTVDLNLGVQATGGAGTDTLSGFENVYGTALNDTLTGDAGDNVLGEGGGGNDTLAGGAGYDVADYFGVVAALTVDLDATPQTITGSGTDTVSGLEGVWGGDGNDTFDGSTADEEFDGAAGTDTVTFADAAAGVTVDLTGEFSDGEGSDGLYGIENVVGSGFDDAIEGTYGTTAALANNNLNGGAGNDWVSYSQAAAGVTVSLALQPAAQATGGGGTDTLSNFEHVAGSAFNDSLTGDAGNNTFTGGDGDDTLTGGLGTDTVDYSAAAAAMTVDFLTGSATGEGSDTLATIENVVGSAFDDSFTGSAGNESFDGGDGVDTISYQFAGASIILDLAAGVATGQGTDLLTAVENVKGSTLADTLLGDGAENKLQGGQGNDEVGGRGGADVLGGSGGNDTLRGAGGNDTLKGGPGGDYLSGGAGKDTCKGGPGEDTVKSCEH